MLRISAASSPYVQLPVSLTVPTGPGDPSSATVQMAFLAADGDPQEADWRAASWARTAVGGWLAECRVGPSGTGALARGRHVIWIKIESAAESVIEPVGLLEVT